MNFRKSGHTLGILVVIPGIYALSLSFMTQVKRGEPFHDDDVTLDIFAYQQIGEPNCRSLAQARKGEQAYNGAQPAVLQVGINRVSASVACIARLKENDVIIVTASADSLTKFNVVHADFSGHYVGQKQSGRT
jgi:hypothetical protein